MKSRLKLKLGISLLCAFALVLASDNSLAGNHPPMSSTHTSSKECEPTPADYLGPYYKPDAPMRSSVGRGHVLEGVVISSADCSPVADARIEFWLTNPDGLYDDDHRATLYSGGIGKYRFESNFPPGYSFRPPHIHIRISADGFKTLATQYYPDEGRTMGIFDIVLVPISIRSESR